jgi:hypothetical protein
MNIGILTLILRHAVGSLSTSRMKLGEVGENGPVMVIE